MYYLYIVIIAAMLHFIIKIFAYKTVQNYLSQTKVLLKAGKYTDGCSAPFKTFIHRYLKKSYLLCAAHDFGGLNLIKNVQPGYHNNFIAWLAHMLQANPVYWIWGTVLAVVTLPWVIFKRDLKQDWMPLIPFYSVLLFLMLVIVLVLFSS